MRAVGDAVGRLLVCESVVVGACGLVGKVLEAVPLRAGLCVDVNFVVICNEWREGVEVNVFLLQLPAVETGELRVVEFPVELDAFTGLDFFRCGFYYRGGEEVDSCCD